MRYFSIIFFASLLLISCGGKHSTVGLQEVTIMDEQQYQLVLYTPRVANVVPLDQQQNAFVGIKNKTGQPLNIDLNWQFWEFDSDTARYRTITAVEPQQETYLDFPDHVFERKGLKAFKVEHHGANGHFSFALMDPMGNDYQSDFRFGVAGVRYNNLDQLHWIGDAMAQIGVQYNRKFIYWEKVQPDSLTWDFSSVDEPLKIMQDKGIHRELLMSGTAHWAMKPGYENIKIKKYAPPRLEPWRKYVATVAERYKNDIQYYEIWNEPDFGFFQGNTEDYVNTLKVAYEEIKKVDSNLTVLTGGFAHVLPRPKFVKFRGDLHKDAIRLGQDYFDVHAVHIHGDYDRFKPYVDGKLADIRKPLKKQQPLWFNETGVTAHQVGEVEQARNVYKKINLIMARNALGVCWFSPQNNIRHSDGAERNYGLISENNSPKSAYVAYNEFVRQMHQVTYLKDIDLGQGIEAFLYQKPGGYILNAWRQEKSTADQLHEFSVSEGTSVKYVDLMGNEKSLPVREGKVVVPVTYKCGYVLFEDAEMAPAYSKKFFALEGSAFADAKDKITMPVKLEASIKSIKSSQDKETIAIENELLSTVSKANHLLLDVDYGDASETLNIPVIRPVLVENKATYSASPNIVVDTYEHVKNRYENDPNTAHLIWKGKADLSAVSYLAINKDYLLVKIVVEDDIHLQPYNNRLIYKGDGIQLGLRTKEMNGVWEIGLAHQKSEKPTCMIFDKPVGFAKKGLLDKMIYTTARQGSTTTYELKLPKEAFGLGKIDQQGFYFNFIVNDNDEGEREGYIQLAEGLGGKKSYEDYKYIIFE
ncbi:hypothetical protein [Persicobacter diffluens]|uniref:Uncharacterized protein n=1 Tax=Persicobacter diffluens TaxID=981 RepID=A0AAN4W2Z3_9BACT|nr:hypothetical protein PEDI_47140 [Persicobacter diffluens]